MSAAPRRAVPLLLAVAGAGGLWILIGPGLQGAAAALLCIAGATAMHLSARAIPPEPCLRIVGRIRVAPRAELAVVETHGRRFLVATGATVTVLPAEDGT